MCKNPLRLLSLVLVVGLLAFSAGRADGQTLYGMTWAGPSFQLLTINTATGAGTVIGPISPGNGLGFRAGKLYTFAADKINELNPATGGTITTIDVGIPPTAWRMGGFAFRSDGIGFVGNGDAGVPQNQLYSFDLVAPSSKLVTGSFVSGGTQIMTFTFDAADVMYGLSFPSTSLYTINSATGVMTLVGSTGIPGNPALGGLAFDPSGKLYAAVSNAAQPSSFYSINPTTGAATLIGNIGVNSVQGIAFATTPPPPPPPPPSPLSLPRPGEGTLGGSRGPRGVEGGFGFGGGQYALAPILLTPQSDDAHSTARVVNASYRLSTPDEVPSLVGDLASALAGLVIAGAITGVVFARKNAQ